MKQYRVPVTLFTYPSAISNARYAMTWAQLRELKATGLFDILYAVTVDAEGNTFVAGGTASSESDGFPIVLVIPSYSTHYTKLYDPTRETTPCGARPRRPCRSQGPSPLTRRTAACSA